MTAIAAFPGSTEPSFVDTAPPTPPASGEVLCRTLQVGICGTDREILNAAAPWVPPGETHLILGHECLARIEQVGSDVTDFQCGDLVVPVVRRPRGNPSHRVDMLSFADYTERGIAYEHGFSSPYWLDRPEFLFHVPQEISDVAVLAEPLAIAEKGLNEATLIQRARLGNDHWQDAPPRVLVTGMGPIGFAGILASRCHQWPVTMYGRDAPDSVRAQAAERLGAKYVSASDDPLCLSDVEGDGFDLILECTGNDRVLLSAAEALAPRGAMVWLGASRVPKASTHNVSKMMRSAMLRNHVHVGCVNSAPRDFEDALAHLGQLHKSDPAALASVITDRISPEQSLRYYCERDRRSIKVVLMYD